VLTTDTSLAVSCTPTSIEEGYWTSCKATVTRSSGTANITGRVDWVVSSADTGTFTTSPCTLSGSGSTASCTVHYTADNIGTGAHVIQATYGGDGNYGRSTASTTETVVADVAPLIATDGISYRTNSGYVQLDEDDSVPQTSDQMRIKVTFNKDVYNVSSTDPDWSDSVTNPDNYRLFFVQSNFSVKTTSCTSDANTFDQWKWRNRPICCHAYLQPLHWHRCEF
jgi:hypothetical protein